MPAVYSPLRVFDETETDVVAIGPLENAAGNPVPLGEIDSLTIAVEDHAGNVIRATENALNANGVVYGEHPSLPGSEGYLVWRMNQRDTLLAAETLDQARHDARFILTMTDGGRLMLEIRYEVRRNGVAVVNIPNVGTYSGFAAVATGATQMVAVATFDFVGTGQAAPVHSGATMAAAGTVTNPTYSASGSPAAGAADMAAAGATSEPQSDGSAAPSAAPATMAAAGTTGLPTFSGAAAPSAAHATMAASATFDIWDPTDLGANLLAFYRTDLLGLGDTDPIAAVPDTTGNHEDLASAGSQRPTFRTNIQNGLAVARFDGSDDTLIKIGFATSIAPAYIFMFVGAFRSTYSSQEAFFDGGADIQAYLVRSVDNANTYFNNGSQIGPVSAATNAWHLWEVRVDGSSSSIRADGGTPVTGTLSATTLTGLEIGRRANGTEYGDIDWGALAILDGDTPSGDVDSMRAWMKARWGTP